MRGEAIVIGASIGGLLAAAALRDSFEQVLVVDRDDLPDAPVFRVGAPQGNQVHALLPFGLRRFEKLLPGIEADILEAGATPYDDSLDIATLLPNGWRARTGCESSEALGMRRPMLEYLVRRRLAQSANVRFETGSVDGLELDDDGRVVGVGLKNGDRLTADLIVAATGRNGGLKGWLEDVGVEFPEETEVAVHVGYATQYIRVPEGLLPDGLKGIAAQAGPGHPIGATLIPADNGIWSLTGVGVMKDYPPTDQDEFFDFLERARTPLVSEIARASELVTEVYPYRIRGNLRRHWERLENPPARLAVVGDAVSSFNPLYGQGMSMAAVAADLLHDIVADDTVPLDDIGEVLQQKLSPFNDMAFAMAAGNDAFYPDAELEGFPAPGPDDAALGAALADLATFDPDVVRAMAKAGFQLDPGALSADDIREKVAAWVRDPGSLAPLDTTRFPVRDVGVMTP
jgi:flavin-dependent dehydrogenase